MPMSDYIPSDKALKHISEKLNECLQLLPKSQRQNDPNLERLVKAIASGSVAVVKLQARRMHKGLDELGREDRN